MTLIQLSEQLKYYRPKLILQAKDHRREITEVLFSDENWHVISSHASLLFVGPLSALSGANFVDKLSGAVCVEDSDTPFPPGIDLILLSPSVNMESVCTQIRSVLQQDCWRIRYWDTILHAVAMHGSINDIISTFSELVDNPVVLADTSTKLIARSRHNISDSILWNDHTRYGCFTYETMQLIDYKRMCKALNCGDIYLQKMTSKYNTLNKAISINGAVIGYISILDANHSFSDNDKKELSHIAKALDYYFKHDDSYQFVWDAKRESFFRNLLERPIVNIDDTTNRARSLNIQEDIVYYIVAATSPSWEESTNLTQVRKDITNLFPSSYSLIYKHSIVLIVPEKACLPEERFPAELCKYLKAQNIVIGISRGCFGVSSIHEQYYQATMAEYTGRKIIPDQSIFFFEDVALDSLFLSAGRTIDLKAFLSPALKSLLQYDVENHTSYIDTLRTYFYSNCDITKAALNLYIHRSTFIYRMKKIEKILGHSMEDHRFRNHIFLSLRILDLLL